VAEIVRYDLPAKPMCSAMTKDGKPCRARASWSERFGSSRAARRPAQASDGRTYLSAPSAFPQPGLQGRPHRERECAAATGRGGMRTLLRQGAHRNGSFAETCIVTLLVVVTLAAIVVAPGQAAQTKTIHVDDNAVPGGSGTATAPYNNLADALAAASATSAAVVIKVAPGDYAVASSLVVDRPLELRGSSVLIEDAEDWPTGDVAAGTQTRVFASNATLAQLIRVGQGGGGFSGVTIRGFVFQGTATGVSVLLTRVQDYQVADNIFRAPARIAMQSVASSGSVIGNHFRGVGAGATLNGGYAESPSNVVVTGNRAVDNLQGGVGLVASSVGIPEVGDRLDAVVRDNDLSGNTAPNQGFGLRVFVMSPEPGVSQSAASVEALIQDNRIDGNRIGVAIDAGFPVRSVGGVCESRVYSGAVDLDLRGNSLTGSLQAPALVAFTRNTAAQNPLQLPLWQYLHGAMYTISDRDGTLDDAWIDHPAADPFLGPCPGDATNEPLGNGFVYNGLVLPNGRNF